jgi:FtsP/CotA-like multicopper oxidase with cupredoxin domain
VGFPDVAATLMEAVTATQFLRLVRRPRRPRRGGRVRLTLKMIPGSLLALLATYIGVGSALTPMLEAYNVAPAVPGHASRSVADLVTPPGSEPVKRFTLTAAVAAIGGNQAWAYNGSVPGPEIRVTQGDRVRVTLVNRLPDATSIHWHGIRLPNAEDGVAGITQNAVRSGGSFVYEFIANDAGTFWYHSHQNTRDQLPRGLLGAIVVEPRAGGVSPDRDYSVTIHPQAGGFPILINGTANLHLDAAPGETVRLRLIDAYADSPPVTPTLFGAPYAVTALDGHDLNQPQLLGPQRIALGMGQRADLVFKMPANGSVRLIGIKGADLPFFGQSTASVVIGDGPAPRTVDPESLPRFDLTGYGQAAPDPLVDAGGFDVTQQILLGNKGPVFRNSAFDMTDTLNGKASPLVPPIQVREGQRVRLRIVNPEASGASHPIHIHGHVFSVLTKNGRTLTGSPIHLDAILVGPRETWEVAFMADNPGIWMLHCHILMHAAGGMSMTINYDGISTPFAMGARSGNVPE